MQIYGICWRQMGDGELVINQHTFCVVLIGKRIILGLKYTQIPIIDLKNIETPGTPFTNKDLL